LSPVDKVGQEKQHEREKVAGLQEAMADEIGPIDGVAMKSSQTEDPVEWCVGPLELAALGLAETKDRTSWVESDVAGLWATMAEGSTKIEEVGGMKVQLSDCCSKVKKDLVNLEEDFAKLKDEMREL
jgi:hypothetical protein